MADNEVGRLSIGVDIDDAAALAKLRALAAAGEQTARHLDRQDAELNVDTSRASRELSAFFRNTERRLDAFKRKEGQLEIEARLSFHKDDLNNIRRQIKQLEADHRDLAKQGDAISKQDQKRLDSLDEQLKTLRNLRRTAEGVLAVAEEQYDTYKHQNKVLNDQITLEEQREKTIVDAENRIANLREKNQREREAAVRTLARQQDQAYRLDKKRDADAERRVRTLAGLQLAAQQLDAKLDDDKERRVRDLAALQLRAHAEDTRRTNDREAAERRMAALHMQGLHLDAQREVTVTRLQKRYTELQKTLGNIERTRLPFDRYKALKLRLDKSHIIAEMAQLEAELELMGRTHPVDIETRLSRSFLGAGLAKVGDWAGSLAETTVRVGPFTTTVKKAAVALTLLGSAIVDVGASLVSLVGVFATGLVGSIAVGTSGLLGMGMAFGGVFAAMKPLAAEYKQLSTLSGAYYRAVASYGKNSKQAATAQKKLNTALSQADPNVRSAIKSMSAARQEWDALTGKMARKSFGSILKESMGTWRTLIPTFASVTNGTLGALDKGVTSLMRMLRSPETQASLRTIGTNFNAGLAPALGGLRELVQWLVRVSASASRYLKPLGDWFKNWATGLNQAAGNTGTLNAQMDRLASHAKSVFKFFGSLGRLLWTVLSGSADAGQNLADSMSNTFDRWTAFLRSTKGQADMGRFFKDAASGAKALWGAVAPILTIFVQWSQIFSPIMSGFAQIIGLAGRAASAILGFFNSFGAGKGALGILGAMYGLRKISNVVNTLRTGSLGGSVAAGAAVGANSMRMGIISGASVASAMLRGAMTTGGARGAGVTAAGGALTSMAGRRAVVQAGGAAAGEAAAAGAGAAAARGTALLSRGAIAARGAIAGLGAALGLTTGGIVALGAVAAGYGAYKLLTMKSAAEKLQESINKTKKATLGAKDSNIAISDSIQLVGQALGEQKNAIGRVSAAKKTLAELDKKGYDDAKKGTEKYNKYRDALGRVTAAVEARTSAEQTVDAARKQRAETFKQLTKMMEDQEKAADQVSKANDEVRKKQEAYDRAQNNPYASDKWKNQLKDKLDNAKAIRDAMVAAQKDLNTELANFQNVQAAAFLSQERYLRGLPALTAAAANALGRLARAQKGKAVASAIGTDATYADPKDAQRVANSAGAALRTRGVSQRLVLKIIADSSSADEAIRRLRNARLEAKYLKVAEKGGKGVLDMLKDIGGVKLMNKAVRILMRDGGAKAKIQDLINLGIPPKIARALVNDSSAKRTLAALENTVLRPLQQIVNRILGNDVPTRVRDAIQYVFRKVKNLVSGGDADGRPANSGRPSNSVVGEGRRWQKGGAKELIANNRTGAVTLVQGAQHISLSRSDYVIPIQDQAHLGRGQRLWDQFNSDMGRARSTLPRYATGKKAALTGKPASDKQKPQVRSATRGRISKIRKKNRPAKNTLALTWVATMNDRRAAEDDERDRVAVLDRRISAKEPESFLTVVGKDPFTGDDIFGLDQAKVSTWQSEMQTLTKSYENLYNMVQKTLAAARKAKEQVGRKLSRLGKNRSTILDLMLGAKNAANRAKTKMGRDRARERYRVYKDALGEEDTKIRAARDTEKDVDSEIHDAGDMSRGRIADSYDDWQKVLGDTNAISVEANKALAESQSAPQFQDPLAAAQAADELFTGRSQLSELSAVADRLSPTKKAIFDAASSYLTDDRSDNDAAGISAIGSLYSDMFGGAGGGGSSSSDEANKAVAQAQFSSAEAARNASALATFAGVGDIGRGGLNALNAAGGSPVININTLHPGDPAVYRAIGNAAATGFGYQGGIGTSRGQVG